MIECDVELEAVQSQSTDLGNGIKPLSKFLREPALGESGNKFVSFRMEEVGTFQGQDANFGGVQIIPRSPFQGDVTPPPVCQRETAPAWNPRCWLNLRSWAGARTRSWWGVAQSSVRSLIDRFQTWPNDDDPNGPRWVVRIASEYENHRGQTVNDISELEFRSALNAEMYVTKLNEQMKKVCPNYPYNVYIFKKDNGEPLDKEYAYDKIFPGYAVRDGD